MKIPRTSIGNVKSFLHALQTLFVFLGFCLTIAVMVKGDTDGRTKYYFAMCFLTLPALVYLTMGPRWPRAAKVANAYAFAIVDILYTIFWLAAFIAVATFNSDGINDGADEAEGSDEEASCSTFAPGSRSMCEVSKATVAFGVFIFLLFCLTAGISIYDAIQFHRDGTSVIISTDYRKANHTTLDAHTKDAWSADTNDLNGGGYVGAGRDEDDNLEHGYEHGYDGGHAAAYTGAGRLGHGDDEDEHALLDAADPGGRLSWGADFGGGGSNGGGYDHGNGHGNGGFDEDTAYRGDEQQQQQHDWPYAGGGVGGVGGGGLTVESGAGTMGGRVKYPTGNYSFSGADG